MEDRQDLQRSHHLGRVCCLSVSVLKDKHLANIGRVKSNVFDLICTVLLQTLVTSAFDLLNKLINKVNFFSSLISQTELESSKSSQLPSYFRKAWTVGTALIVMASRFPFVYCYFLSGNIFIAESKDIGSLFLQIRIYKHDTKECVVFNYRHSITNWARTRLRLFI